MYSFEAPYFPPAKNNADAQSMLIVSVDNTPRFSDSILRDILSYEKNGQAFMHDMSFLSIAGNRKCPMLSRPPAPKIRQLLIRSRYVSPTTSDEDLDVSSYTW